MEHRSFNEMIIFLKIFITESFNIAGTTLFAFKVLPRLDSIQAIILMNTFSVIPSMLSLFFIQKSNRIDEQFGILFAKCFRKASIRIKFEIAFNLLAFLVQISTFAVIFSPILSVENTWDLCLSIVFVSISYWENFINTDLIGMNKIYSEKIKNFKKSIESSRHKTLLFINLWKIALIILISYGLHPNIFTKIETLFNGNQNHYLAFFTQTISSLLCSYLSLLACKLCMQRTSFSVPLILTYPLFFSIILLLSKYMPDESDFKKAFLNPENSYTNEFKWILVFGLIWWLSHLWVNRHIWKNIIDRNIIKKNIFYTPSYSNIFIDQHLMLSRMRNYIEDDNENCLNLSYEKVMLYSCATMWHENEQETLQLLTSIMR